MDLENLQKFHIGDGWFGSCKIHTRLLNEDPSWSGSFFLCFSEGILVFWRMV